MRHNTFAVDVLEQLRLLTNLETADSRKLLKVLSGWSA